MKILLKVDYSDSSGRFWQDSYIKNKVIEQKEGETIHETIRKAIEEFDGLQLTYKGKPTGNVFIDGKDGEPIRIGYMYRAKTDIYNDEKRKNQTAYFDVWTSVKKVEPLEVEEID